LAGAVALETSAGLLLYIDDGLLPALTLILVVEIGALGLGLCTAPLPVGGGAVEQIRRRWLFCLVAFAMGSALAAGLNFRSDLAGTGLAQGAGLGLLGALPLFSVGALLGAMARPDDLGRVPGAPVGPPAVLGAAIGFLLAGVVLLPNLAPHTLYLFCLVILSGGALLQGWVLDVRIAVEVIARGEGRNGDLRVERRILGTPRRELMVLREGEIVRGAENPAGRPGRVWEAAVLEILAPDRIQPESVLYLGGGSGTLGRLLSQRFPHAEVQLIEMDEGVVDLSRSYFKDWDGWDEIDLVPEGVLDGRVGNGASVVVVDAGVLPTLGGIPFLRDTDWHLLENRVEAGGFMVMGGLGSPGASSEAEVSGALSDLVRDGREWFQGVSLFRRTSERTETRLFQEWPSGAEFLLVFSTDGAPPTLPALSDFRLIEVEEV
jgi:hypothetical protein